MFVCAFVWVLVCLCLNGVYVCMYVSLVCARVFVYICVERMCVCVDVCECLRDCVRECFCEFLRTCVSRASVYECMIMTV